jgi:hypothetical protein
MSPMGKLLLEQAVFKPDGGAWLPVWHEVQRPVWDYWWKLLIMSKLPEWRGL